MSADSWCWKVPEGGVMRIERLRRAVSGFERVGNADITDITKALKRDTGGFVSVRRG